MGAPLGSNQLERELQVVYCKQGQTDCQCLGLSAVPKFVSCAEILSAAHRQIVKEKKNQPNIKQHDPVQHIHSHQTHGEFQHILLSESEISPHLHFCKIPERNISSKTSLKSANTFDMNISAITKFLHCQDIDKHLPG